MDYDPGLVNGKVTPAGFKLYALAAPNYAAVIESYVKAMEVGKQAK